ncbi:agamous-like MADS-box protein AGL80 [Telopea speciosissima]|uniref:agamous-like MADS-box protein AGL80 n=1 Tax=Telopea speciosissima TaxID=54955 RepID=UPI001CC3D96B|nr:agamous-like MADS-box protein AGL80 [Telopea speciosissima]
MPKKIKLELIPEMAARKATFNRRKKGIMKKLHELHTLCDVPICAVIYGPCKEEEPIVWPSPLEVENMINLYKNLPEIQQCRKKVTHEEYLKQRIARVEEKLKRVRKKNRKLKITKLFNECLKNKDFHDQNILDVTDLKDLSKLADEKMKLIDERIETLMGNPPPPPQIGTSRSAAAGEPNGEEI